MNLDEGKRLYSSFFEAEKVAEKMSRTFNEGFNAYKVGAFWAVGGVHMKSADKKQKIKSFDDIRILLDEFKESEEDTSIEDYISEIETESLNKESSIQGQSDIWVLKDVALKEGRELGMSSNNVTIYLALTLEKNSECMTIKMGGAFDRHIPLIRRQAEKLKNKEIVWHTWNNTHRPPKWSKDAWFYRIEAKETSENQDAP